MEIGRQIFDKMEFRGLAVGLYLMFPQSFTNLENGIINLFWPCCVTGREGQSECYLFCSKSIGHFLRTFPRWEKTTLKVVFVGIKDAQKSILQKSRREVLAKLSKMQIAKISYFKVST